MGKAQIYSKTATVLSDCMIRGSQPAKVNTSGEMAHSTRANLKMVAKMDWVNGRKDPSSRVTSMRATFRMI